MYGPLALLARFDPFLFSIYLGATPDLPPWANYGLLGAILLAILTRQLIPGWVDRDRVVALEGMRKERDAYKEEAASTITKLLTVSESAVPALRESTAVLNQAIEEIRLIRQRRR